MKNDIYQMKALSEATRVTRATERLTTNLAALAQELEAACDRIAEVAGSVSQIGKRDKPDT